VVIRSNPDLIYGGSHSKKWQWEIHSGSQLGYTVGYD
jgi:hypothetical protein